MFVRLITSISLGILFILPVRAEVQLESKGDYFAVGNRYTVDIYCYSQRENGQWMGSEWCDNVSVRSGDYDRLVGPADPKIDTALLVLGRAKFTLKYDGARGVSDRFRVLDVVPDGNSDFVYQLVGKNGNGQRAVLEQGTIPVHAEFKITQGWSQTYPYWVRPGDVCAFRPAREQVCNSCSPPHAAVSNLSE
jgi:hypothetical protein